jgi:hypothetical protein
MTDKELLELAAKAAGWTGWQSKHGYWNVESPDGEKTTHLHHWKAYCPDTGTKIGQSTFADAIEDTNWNPLADDGDALRLAVACGIAVTPYPIYEWPKQSVVAARRSIESSSTEVVELYGENPDVATRRAIVRAAAEMGRAK